MLLGLVHYTLSKYASAHLALKWGKEVEYSTFAKREMGEGSKLRGAFQVCFTYARGTDSSLRSVFSSRV